MGIATSKRIPEPNSSILSLRHRGRSTWASRGSLPRPPPKLSVLFTQERNLHNDPESTGGENGPSGRKNYKVYISRRGEEILFGPPHPPPGYEYVPCDDVFIIRRCRKIAQKKLYAAFSHRSRRRPAKRIGLYVPSDIFDKVKIEFEAKRAKTGEKLDRDLNRDYPQMPLADRRELHRLISRHYPGVTGKLPLDLSIICAYIRDRYTLFKFLGYRARRNSNMIARADERAQEVLAAWRGEDSSKERDT